MKKLFLFIEISLVLFTFSCTYHSYPQKTVGNSVSVQHSSQPYFLFISDIHLDISVEHTDSTTDTGMDLWKAFEDKLESIVDGKNPPAFVLCTGDLPGH